METILTSWSHILNLITKFLEVSKNLKDNFLSDDIISCYLDELVVSSQKKNNILIFKSIISAINIFFVTYQFTGDFLEYLCNENSVNPSFIFFTAETP